MNETELISLGAAAQWLSAQTAGKWTPALLIDRLLGHGAPSVFVLLPKGWSLLREDDGEPARPLRPSLFRVCDGEDFLEQFAMFGDLSIANALPRRIEDALGCGFRSIAPVPAAMLRLLPEELRAVAAAAGGAPAATFMRRVAQMRAGTGAGEGAGPAPDRPAFPD